MLAVVLFLAGCAVGALLMVLLATPGPWPPERPRRDRARRLKQERESWLH